MVYGLLFNCVEAGRELFAIDGILLEGLIVLLKIRRVLQWPQRGRVNARVDDDEGALEGGLVQELVGVYGVYGVDGVVVVVYDKLRQLLGSATLVCGAGGINGDLVRVGLDGVQLIVGRS